MRKTKTIKLRITQKHIEAGRPAHPTLCAIAIALRARGYRGVSVAQLGIECGGWCSKPNAKVRRFITQFDIHVPVTPTELTLTFTKGASA
jgi:hypothetical protein